MNLSLKTQGVHNVLERYFKDTKSNREKFENFKEQDLLNIDQDLNIPEYSGGRKRERKKFQKEQDAMLSLFNARKDEVLGRRATPGLDQLRF